MENIFSCRGCGFCCQLDVVLTKQDIRRLEIAGFEGFTRAEDDVLMLRMKGRHCLFYVSGMCRIYENRPDICRRFPFRIDGSVSQKCRQMRDFSSQVSQKIIKFMIEDRKH